jgi:transcriptional regulator GlxA family with amidase domain
MAEVASRPVAARFPVPVWGVIPGYPEPELTLILPRPDRSAARLHHRLAWPGPATPQGLNPRALLRTLSFIEAHLAEPLTLDDLAAAACVSRAHFARCFHASTGRTPMNYLMWLRVQQAELELGRERVRLCELATSLGFNDQSHFCRIFRRFTGYSPGAYARARNGAGRIAAESA